MLVKLATNSMSCHPGGKPTYKPEELPGGNCNSLYHCRPCSSCPVEEPLAAYICRLSVIIHHYPLYYACRSIPRTRERLKGI